MIKYYRAGDKVLIECTVLVDSDSPVVRVELDSTTGNHLGGQHIFTRAIKGHTPKPVEPARGQLWYDSDQEYNNHVIACEDGWVMYRNTSSNQPYMMPVATFQKAKRYVSG